ncbi:MAG: hypothetical protein IT249_17725 [Chitinophagaceae bacterium]|nr:hypothetical protein [Chitinophagaceae bacterium]
MTSKEIISHYKDISLTETTATVQNKFCDIWPNAKTALEILQQIIKNPIAKAAIGIVISTGDAIAKKLCGK